MSENINEGLDKLFEIVRGKINDAGDETEKRHLFEKFRTACMHGLTAKPDKDFEMRFAICGIQDNAAGMLQGVDEHSGSLISDIKSLESFESSLMMTEAHIRRIRYKFDRMFTDAGGHINVPVWVDAKEP